MIPDPLNPMAYNRYMYVYGNPVRYNDPSGHNPALIIGAIGAVIFTIGATSDDPTVQKVGTFVGSIMMMYGAGANGLGLSASESGALVGFSTTYISTGGDFGEAVKSGVISAVSASVSEGIGHGFDGSGEGYFAEGSFGRMVSHGVAQGFISKLRGESFRSGFVSGFVGSAGGALTRKLGFTGTTDADRLGSTTITVVFAGLATEASGGDFYEGAMRAAFVHLFNELYLATDIKEERFIKATAKMRNKHKNAYYIYAHGTDGGFLETSAEGEFLSVYDTDDIIEMMKDDGYKTGTEVVLFACQTGKSNKFYDNVAEQIRDKLETTIYAPTTFLAVPPSWMVNIFNT